MRKSDKSFHSYPNPGTEVRKHLSDPAAVTLHWSLSAGFCAMHKGWEATERWEDTCWWPPPRCLPWNICLVPMETITIIFYLLSSCFGLRTVYSVEAIPSTFRDLSLLFTKVFYISYYAVHFLLAPLTIAGAHVSFLGCFSIISSILIWII